MYVSEAKVLLIDHLAQLNTIMKTEISPKISLSFLFICLVNTFVFASSEPSLRKANKPETKYFWVGFSMPICIYNDDSKVTDKATVYGHTFSVNTILKNDKYLSYNFMSLCESGSQKGVGEKGSLAAISNNESYQFHSFMYGANISESPSCHFIIGAGLSIHNFNLRGAYDHFDKAVWEPPFYGSILGIPIFIPGYQVSAAAHHYKMEQKIGVGVPITLKYIPRVNKNVSPEISFTLDLNAARPMAFLSVGLCMGNVIEKRKWR
ncbi:MAG: hypothetical protein CFE21_04320 [Bacteroidetes bacterium B1(2017)]|nr:MAG: hypothetical protein CFE21_04320 [Bacteroidetes bacterium B1(2017)]